MLFRSVPYTGGYENQVNYLSTGNIMESPSEFKINFYSKIGGDYRENTMIPRIARGVIDRIDVDYAPQGQFSTFSNGHPVASMLTFTFREMRIIGKDNVLQGY